MPRSPKRGSQENVWFGARRACLHFYILPGLQGGRALFASNIEPSFWQFHSLQKHNRMTSTEGGSSRNTHVHAAVATHPQAMGPASASLGSFSQCLCRAWGKPLLWLPSKNAPAIKLQQLPHKCPHACALLSCSAHQQGGPSRFALKDHTSTIPTRRQARSLTAQVRCHPIKWMFRDSLKESFSPKPSKR